MRKKYSLRVNFIVEADSDDDMIRKTKIIINELPRMDGLSFKDRSIFSFADKKVVATVNGNN
ncbi:MAG: hypothetical protein AABY22_04395 [Nanoarchaeota archaeon]